MESKSTKIRAALAAGNDKQALRIASKFFDRGADTQLYKAAYESNYTNPAFYKQLGKDPEKLMAQAMANLRGRFLNDGQQPANVR